jgi:hypothetical protein
VLVPLLVLLGSIPALTVNPQSAKRQSPVWTLVIETDPSPPSRSPHLPPPRRAHRRSQLRFSALARGGLESDL